MTAPELDSDIHFDDLIAKFEENLYRKSAKERAKIAGDFLRGLVLAEREHAVRCAASVKFQSALRIANCNPILKGETVPRGCRVCG